MSKLCWKRALVSLVSRQLSESDCRQLRFISSLPESKCPCPKHGGGQGDHLLSLEELERQGSFSLSNDGLENLAISLEAIGRVDVAEKVRQKIRREAKSGYDQCAIAMTEMGLTLQNYSQHLSDRQMVAKRLQRTVDQVMQEGTRRLAQAEAEVVPREENHINIGEQSRRTVAVERDGRAQPKRTRQPPPGCRGNKPNLQSHPLASSKGKKLMLPLAVKQKPFRTTSSLQQNARELILPPQVPAPPPPTIIPDELSSLTNQDYDYGQQTTTYYIETDLLASRPDLQCQPQSQPIPPTRRISKAEQTAEITTSASTSPKTSQSRRSAAKPFGIPQPRILQSQNRAFSKSLYTIDTSDYIDGYDSGYSGSGSSSNSVSSIGHNWRRQELSPVHGAAFQPESHPQQVYTRLSDATRDDRGSYDAPTPVRRTPKKN